MSKYFNKKCTVGGIVFDSRKEARRYQELLLFKRAGIITNLERQKKYILIPAQYETFPRYGKKGQELTPGKRLIEHECSYVADFVYDEGGKTVVEDTKGMKTKDYILKRKMLLYFYGIKIKEV